MWKVVEFVVDSGKLYAAWAVVHVLAANAYTYWCVPLTVSGLTMSPLMVTAPHCKGLLWLTNTAADVTTTMWVVLGSWLVTNVVRRP